MILDKIEPLNYITVQIMKHDIETINDVRVFSIQDCGCKFCYKKAQTIILAELKSLNVIETYNKGKDDDDTIMRLTQKFADALPSSDDWEIESLTNEDIWSTLITRFNQKEPDAIQDYGMVIRMIIDILIEDYKAKHTTNKHGGDMYGV